MKSKKNTEDIVIEELEKSFIEDYYNWMLGTCAFGELHCLRACQYPEMADVYRAGKRLDTGPSVRIIRVYARIQEALLPFQKRNCKGIIRIELRYKRQRAMRDMFLFMCFTGLSYADLKTITYDNIHTDSDGGTWLMGNRIKTGVAYVVKIVAHCHRAD